MKAKILEPIPDGNDAFVWAQFEVRKSQFGDFMGVYAKQNSQIYRDSYSWAGRGNSIQQDPYLGP